MGIRYFLGLDLGSISLVASITDESGKLLWHKYQRVYGRAKAALAALSNQILEAAANLGITEFDGALVCGSGKEIVADTLGIGVENEIVAHGTAAARFAGGRASVIEIGGQDSKFILVDEHGPYDYAMNELCAAGTGAFLDVQAERLGLAIEELSKLAAQAKNIPAVAGRCSVFAKSDIIHLQQRGVPVDEIVAGLCFALARNYIATLIRGREVIKPVVFQGGVALNKGVLRAFRELLKLTDQEMRVPEHPHIMGAYGSALLAAERGSKLSLERLAEVAKKYHDPSAPKIVQLEGWRMENAQAKQNRSLEEYILVREPEPTEDLFLGIDVGSVSTDVAVITSDGELIAKVYTFTAGRPLEAVARAFEFVGNHVRQDQIRAVGATGSGRKLVGFFAGADAVIDEISAQARGAAFAVSGADTVIEIGGQDAKFIRVDADGSVLDFEMNRICSAGTGSFLQEQAVRLGVDLKRDFARLALSSTDEIPLTSRCTVFMESDLVHHLQRGAKLPDLLAGIARAVVENYLDRVALGKKPGKKVVLQGGVAQNAAVVEAFRKRLPESEVVVHPEPQMSGAIGVALFARDYALATGQATKFAGFKIDPNFEISTFICRSCENQCEVKVFKTSAGRFYFGDLCGKYGEMLSDSTEEGYDYTETHRQLLAALTSASKDSANKLAVPETLLFPAYFPFWKAFFAELGIELTTSGVSTAEKLHRGLQRIPAETCLPVKLLFGHVAELVERGERRIFIPASDTLEGGMPCPYVQHAAAMIQSVFRDIEVISFGLVPGLNGRSKDLLVAEVAEALNLPKSKVKNAYELAEESYRVFQKLTEAKIPKTGLTAVIIGKPYNTTDRFLNLALSSKLAKAGFNVIGIEQLSGIADIELSGCCDEITWAHSRKMVKAALMVKDIENAFPVVLSHFGCGPDAFTLPVIEEMLGDKPVLFLELDEHRADAGLETRIEAFAQRVRTYLRKIRAQKPTSESVESRQEAQHPSQAAIYATEATSANKPKFIIPYFSDHAYAFEGAIRAEGYDAEVLPLPDRESYEYGQELSGGKQCHPFQLISGDIIKLLKQDRLPYGSIYLFPIVGSTCLITQYAPTIQRYLEKLGRGDVRVIGAGSGELSDMLGTKFLLNLWRGIVGIEYLLRLRFELRPYEVEKGSTDAAYRRALKRLVESLAQYQAHRGIMNAVFELDRVKTQNRGTKPVIGIAGDVYTRVNPAANGGLFDILEELGCEVWLSPTIMDVTLTGTELDVGKHWKQWQLWDATYSWAKALVQNMELWQVQRHFKNVLRNLVEPDGDQVAEYIKDLLPGEPELLVALNVAKHIDFARKGVDGILNVFCLNCMVGTSTAAVFPALKTKTGIPIMSIVLDGFGSTHLRNRLEAFVHRVKRFRAERRAVEEAV